MSKEKKQQRIISLNKRNASPLRDAAEDGHLVRVQKLVRDGAVVNDTSLHWNGEHALFGAIESQHYQTVAYLVNSGSDLTITGKNGFSVMQAACLEGEMTVVLYLFGRITKIEEYDMWAPNKAGWNMLHWAAFGGHNRTIAWLMENRPQDNNGPIPLEEFLNVPTKNGQTMVHIAAKQGHKNLISWLVPSGADVNAVANNGETPLHIATTEGNTQTTRSLVENNADIMTANRFGFLPIHLCAARSHYDCFKELLAWHTRNFRSDETDPRNVINIPTRQGWTVLALACREGCADIVQKIIPLKPKANTVTVGHFTPLKIAAMDGHVDIAQLLLSELEADVDLQDEKGITPLMTAAKYGNFDTATCICDNGASINLEDEDGMTALHFAAMSGNYKICSLVASRGAKLDIKNVKGESAARIAFRMGNTKCIEVLCATQYYDEQRPGAPHV
jgi:ankyrin repeat protein